MMNAQLFTNQEAALLNADAYLRSEGLEEVISPRRLVQKVNLNTTFHADFGNHAYMVVELGNTISQELRANADALQAKRDEKIAKLQAELDSLMNASSSLPATKVDVIVTSTPVEVKSMMAQEEQVLVGSRDFTQGE